MAHESQGRFGIHGRPYRTIQKLKFRQTDTSGFKLGCVKMFLRKFSLGSKFQTEIPNLFRVFVQGER